MYKIVILELCNGNHVSIRESVHNTVNMIVSIVAIVLFGQLKYLAMEY